MKLGAAFLLVFLCGVSPVLAGDEAEHLYMIQALAAVAGFSPQEAKIIADGSWSMDKNPSTTAFRGLPSVVEVAFAGGAVIRDPEFAQRLLTDNRTLDTELFSPTGRLARIGPAALIHSLMHDPRQPPGVAIKPGLDAAYHRYIREQIQRFEVDGLAAADRKTIRLLLIGQYIHQFVDAFVHPEDPLIGHVLAGHAPDQAWANPTKFKQAAFYALKELRLLRTELGPADDRMKALHLDTEQRQQAFCSQLVDAIARGYGRKIKTPSAVYQEISRADLVRITVNVEELMNRFFTELGTSYRFRIAPFDKVTYLPEGETFRLQYRGLEATVDSFVAWVVARDQYADLVASIRAKLREHIEAWHRLGERARALGYAAENLRAILDLLQLELEALWKEKRQLADAIAGSLSIELKELRASLREAHKSAEWMASEAGLREQAEGQWREAMSRLPSIPPQIDGRPEPVVRTTRSSPSTSSSRPESPSERGWSWDRSGGRGQYRPSRIDWEGVRSRINRVIRGRF